MVRFLFSLLPYFLSGITVKQKKNKKLYILSMYLICFCLFMEMMSFIAMYFVWLISVRLFTNRIVINYQYKMYLMDTILFLLLYQAGTEPISI